MFKKVQSAVSGFKTYAVALFAAVLGVVNVFQVHHFDVTNVAAFVSAGGLGALRAAVSKVELALKAKK